MKKYFCHFLCCVSMLILATSCGSSSDSNDEVLITDFSIVGTWNQTKASAESMKQTNKLFFRSNDTGYWFFVDDSGPEITNDFLYEFNNSGNNTAILNLTMDGDQKREIGRASCRERVYVLL